MTDWVQLEPHSATSVLVLARTSSEAQAAAISLGLSRRDWIYVGDGNAARGRMGPVLIRVAGAELNPNYERCMLAILPAEPVLVIHVG